MQFCHMNCVSLASKSETNKTHEQTFDYFDCRIDVLCGSV